MGTASGSSAHSRMRRRSSRFVRLRCRPGWAETALVYASAANTRGSSSSVPLTISTYRRSGRLAAKSGSHCCMSGPVVARPRRRRTLRWFGRRTRRRIFGACDDGHSSTTGINHGRMPEEPVLVAIQIGMHGRFPPTNGGVRPRPPNGDPPGRSPWQASTRPASAASRGRLGTGEAGTAHPRPRKAPWRRRSMYRNSRMAAWLPARPVPSAGIPQVPLARVP